MSVNEAAGRSREERKRVVSDDEDVSFLKELERENQALEQELKAIQDSYVEKATKSFTNLSHQSHSHSSQLASK